MMERGIVTGLDRVANTAQVALQAGPTVDAVLLTEPPCPRSVVMVEQAEPGQYVVIGQEGFRRSVLHEDFGSALKGNAIGVFTPLHADLTWWYVEGTVGTTAQAISTTTLSASSGTPTDRIGGLDVATGGAIGQYVMVTRTPADTVGFPGGALGVWATLTLGGGSSITNSVIHGGLGTINAMRFLGLLGTDRRAIVRYDSATSPNWQFVTTVGAAETTTITDTPAVASSLLTADIVVSPGQWAALYLNGSLAALHTTNIPEVYAIGSPSFAVYPRAAAARGAVLERFDATVVSGLVIPT